MVNFYLDREIYDQITTYCNQNNISYASLIRDIIGKAVLDLKSFRGEIWHGNRRQQNSNEVKNGTLK